MASFHSIGFMFTYAGIDWSIGLCFCSPPGLMLEVVVEPLLQPNIVLDLCSVHARVSA